MSASVLYHNFSTRYCIEIYVCFRILSQFQYKILYWNICRPLYCITILVQDTVLNYMSASVLYHNFSSRYCIEIYVCFCIVSQFQFKILCWNLCLLLYCITISVQDTVLKFMPASASRFIKGFVMYNHFYFDTDNESAL